jgi:hypothetical protein
MEAQVRTLSFKLNRQPRLIISVAFCTLDVAAYPANRAGSYRAGVAELADAHGSGPCTRKGVGVRVPSSAPIT